jgi:cell division protein FtsL
MRGLITGLLAIAVFASAVQVVISQHQARKIFIELQKLEKVRDDLAEEWGRLQLEQGTWANDDRIENLARGKLDMNDPELDSIVLIDK